MSFVKKRFLTTAPFYPRASCPGALLYLLYPYSRVLYRLNTFLKKSFSRSTIATKARKVILSGDLVMRWQKHRWYPAPIIDDSL